MPKTLRELELENKLKDLENKILKEQKSVMLRNAFLGKFNRDDMRRIDQAIKNAKEGLEETSAALNERNREIKAKEREQNKAKLKIHLNHKKNQRAKQPKQKGKKKKNQSDSAGQATSESQDTSTSQQAE